MNFFSQKQKPIRNFFSTNRFDQIEIIFEQFRFWLVRMKLYFEKKNSGKLIFWQNFFDDGKMIFEWFQKWPRKTNPIITWLSDRGRNNLETGITWPFSKTFSTIKFCSKILFVFSKFSKSRFFGKKFEQNPFREKEDGRWGAQILLSHFICRVLP